MAKPDYDTTLARIAGNILSGSPHIGYGPNSDRKAAEWAVSLARAVVAEVKRASGSEAVPAETEGAEAASVAPVPSPEKSTSRRAWTGTTTTE